MGQTRITLNIRTNYEQDRPKSSDPQKGCEMMWNGINPARGLMNKTAVCVGSTMGDFAIN